MAEKPAARPPHKLLALTEPSRAMGELASFYALRPMMGLLPRGDGHGVLVLPGFMASDHSTRPLRSLLSSLGYETAGWGLGRNVRVDNARIAAMLASGKDVAVFPEGTTTDGSHLLPFHGALLQPAID